MTIRLEMMILIFSMTISACLRMRMKTRVSFDKLEVLVVVSRLSVNILPYNQSHQC